MQAIHARDIPRALALVDAGHAALPEQRCSLRATGEALAAVAEHSPGSPAVLRAGMRIGAVAGTLGVRTSALRFWESAGLLTPTRKPGTGHRRFGPTDVRDARMIKLLRQGGYRSPQIRTILDGLRRMGSSDARRAAVAQRQAGVTLRTTALLEGSRRLSGSIADRAPEGSAPPAPYRPSNRGGRRSANARSPSA